MADKYQNVDTDCGDLLTKEEFAQCVEDGSFIPYDSVGYYTDGKVYRHLNIVDFDPDLIRKSPFTHVIWFNK